MSRTGARAWLAPIARRRLPDEPGHLLDELRVPAGGLADGLREAGRVAGHDAVQALLVEDGRDAQACLLDQEALDLVAEVGDLPGRQVRGAGHPRDLADALGQPLACPLEVEAAAVEDLERPQRAELGQLLVEGHAGEEVACPLLGAQARGRDVAVRSLRGAWSPPPMSSSSLDRPGREPAHDLALGDDVEDQGRDQSTAS